MSRLVLVLARALSPPVVVEGALRTGSRRADRYIPRLFARSPSTASKSTRTRSRPRSTRPSPTTSSTASSPRCARSPSRPLASELSLEGGPRLRSVVAAELTRPSRPPSLAPHLSRAPAGQGLVQALAQGQKAVRRGVRPRCEQRERRGRRRRGGEHGALSPPPRRALLPLDDSHADARPPPPSLSLSRPQPTKKVKGKKGAAAEEDDE